MFMKVFKNFLFIFLNITLSLISFCVSYSVVFLGFKRKIVLQNLKRTKQSFWNVFLIYYQCFYLIFSFLIWMFLKKRKKIFIDSNTYQKMRILQKEGGIILTAHYGDWEFGGYYLNNQKDFRFFSVAQPLKSSFWNSLVKKSRRKKKISVIDENVSRETLKKVKDQKIVSFLLDQHFYRGIKGVFFSHVVFLNPLPIRVVLHTQKPCFVFLVVKGRLRVISIYRSNLRIDETKIVKRYLKILQTVVLMNPSDWMGFFHRFFKEN